MSKIKFQGNARGTGVLTITSPNTNADRTITLPDEDVTLGAGTPSIDDNGNATAITIDSNENLLIGKTTYVGGSGVTGIDIRPAGMVNIAREGDTLMYMNRKTSDGDIVEFRKDGTTKGSIGVTSSGAYITLGGTGSANTLEDYEEGTWTPTFAGATMSPGNTVAYYTKIGRQVFFQWYSSTVSISSASGGAEISGLPFTASSATEAYGLFTYVHGTAVDGGSTGGYVGKNTNKMHFIDTNGFSKATYVNGTKYIMISGSYFVA